ncbi:hypothetical protein M8J76_016016 [Diaphorina citri]|nr:hypothetical protein M8J76_016016 [Diaphorina citri]
MLNQFILVFLMLIFYQQISCSSWSLSNGKQSRIGRPSQTFLYRVNETMASDVFDRLERSPNHEKDGWGLNAQPNVNEHPDLNSVQNTPFVNRTPSTIVKDFTHENLAQITNANAKTNFPSKRLKLSATVKKKAEISTTESSPNMDKSSNQFKTYIEEVSSVNIPVPDDLESVSSDRDSQVSHQTERLNRPDESQPLDKSDSVVIKTDFDTKTNQTVLKSIYLPTYNNFTIFSGVTIQPTVEPIDDEFNSFVNNDLEQGEEGSQLLARSIETFSKNHVVNVDLNKLYEAFTGVDTPSDRPTARFAFTKNSFLTGFSLGFLAFALKKLLLPFFIGIQIVKSILIAMFLPSILGSVGKLVGKGVSNFAQSSSSSGGGGGGGFHMGGGGGGDTIQDFEFKDTSDTAGAESNGLNGVWSLPPSNMNALANANVNNYLLDGLNQNKMNNIHNHLLANYDPFYSPLLSRIDSVFKQLNYKTESCRERLICAMYNNPAKYAPYSNLVSAQLSRELNELRKPTSDNPEILRFFRYMKAAKDGQDQLDCAEVYSACATGSRGGGTLETSPPMVTTFNDINRLVHARKMQLRNESKSQSADSVSAHAQRSESTQGSESAQDSVSAHVQSEPDQGRELSAQDQGIQSGQEGVESTHAQGSELNQGKELSAKTQEVLPGAQGNLTQ